MIDTRDKIVSMEEARQVCEECPLVAGYFDPLLPEQVRRLKALGTDLVVVIVSPPDPYMEARARAEVAASLSFVRAVAIADENFEHPVEELQDRNRFIMYVRERAG